MLDGLFLRELKEISTFRISGFVNQGVLTVSD